MKSIPDIPETLKTNNHKALLLPLYLTSIIMLLTRVLSTWIRYEPYLREHYALFVTVTWLFWSPVIFIENSRYVRKWGVLFTLLIGYTFFDTLLFNHRAYDHYDTILLFGAIVLWIVYLIIEGLYYKHKAVEYKPGTSEDKLRVAFLMTAGLFLVLSRNYLSIHDAIPAIYEYTGLSYAPDGMIYHKGGALAWIFAILFYLFGTRKIGIVISLFCLLYVIIGYVDLLGFSPYETTNEELILVAYSLMLFAFGIILYIYKANTKALKVILKIAGIIHIFLFGALGLELINENAASLSKTQIFNSIAVIILLGVGGIYALLKKW